MENPIKGKINFGTEDPFEEDPNILEDLKRIVGVFSGEDGGVDYVILQAFLLRIEDQRKEVGAKRLEAEILLDIVVKFRKLIDAVCK